MKLDDFAKELGYESEDKIPETELPIIKKSFDTVNKMEVEKTQAIADIEYQTKESKVAYDKRDATNILFKESEKKVRDLEMELSTSAKDVELKPKLEKANLDLTKAYSDLEVAEANLIKVTEDLDKSQNTLMDVRTTMKKSYVDQLPKGSDAYNFAESLSADEPEKIINFVNLEKVKKLTTDETMHGDFKIDPNKKWDDFNSAELDFSGIWERSIMIWVLNTNSNPWISMA